MFGHSSGSSRSTRCVFLILFLVERDDDPIVGPSRFLVREIRFFVTTPAGMLLSRLRASRAAQQWSSTCVRLHTTLLLSPCIRHLHLPMRRQPSRAGATQS